MLHINYSNLSIFPIDFAPHGASSGKSVNELNVQVNQNKNREWWAHTLVPYWCQFSLHGPGVKSNDTYGIDGISIK